MKKKLLLLLLAPLALSAQQRPKLVVGIVVDQMKMEYLYRFSSDFTKNGFKKLMDDGFVFENMHYNYMPTYTAPGHASIYTGTTPSVHGIVSNEWYSASTGKERYCTDDAGVTTVGNGTPQEGAMSPKNLLATTITDELRLSTNFKGKVIGMSLKDRGAILPAGHFANWAFWYSKTGEFISSTFYGQQLPEWVTKFNAQKRFMSYINKGWDLLLPEEAYNESLADDNKYEGKLYGKAPVFPYDLKEMYAKNDAGILRATPFGNDLLLEFAKVAVDQESLGVDNDTDFLTVSFSSTDYVGHIIGPRSVELQDTYLRLDRNIADLIAYLDGKVGKGNYLMFLTADHAGAENVTFLKDHKYDVTNIPFGEMSKNLKQFSLDTFGTDVIADFSNNNLYLNRQALKDKSLEPEKVKSALSDYLMTLPQTKRVYSKEVIIHAGGADYYLSCIAKGYDPRENGDLVVLFRPGYIEYGPTGTSHGTPYSYDTHVPAIFYGWHVRKGISHDKKTITQIAPTLAQKLGITFPNGSECIVLPEILNEE
ncbi:alkaline phosphatase [Flavobacterium magnum]|uniref:Alkaline phosphatase n=1 Tax=Flavobacterium magnum TaxID=2162713 RepID=A0A2S0RFB3_9FLAO|nr:alkaline phosphatase PafA [Flavobacterium magnum]AWA30219.1 alkaline phosphatase [Flavobacterium magnum]